MCVRESPLGGYDGEIGRGSKESKIYDDNHQRWVK